MIPIIQEVSIDNFSGREENAFPPPDGHSDENALYYSGVIVKYQYLPHHP